MFETFTALLVILELIEASAGRRQQYGVARCSMRAGVGHGVFESFAVASKAPRPLRASWISGLAAPISKAPLARCGERRAQGSVVAALVLSAENDPQARRKRIDGL